MKEKIEEIGEISHYYSKIGVAIVELRAPLSVGDTILISGVTTNFKQTVNSMQIEHKDVRKAATGQSIGLKVEQKVREKDMVYSVSQ